jgi:hypothetical protein
MNVYVVSTVAMVMLLSNFNNSLTAYSRVSQPGFRGNLGFREMSLGVPREIMIEKKVC